MRYQNDGLHAQNKTILTYLYGVHISDSSDQTQKTDMINR